MFILLLVLVHLLIGILLLFLQSLKLVEVSHVVLLLVNALQNVTEGAKLGHNAVLVWVLEVGWRHTPKVLLIATRLILLVLLIGIVLVIQI